ncbi:MauE/DoxX family redox-associated membrane protein [Flavobacterium sp.]|uniref:MauE/DoxX family redox-associated membrane protein n=1 Tax=Flavobacterium sp. TaxID=239 RepID=UPI0026286433|nr:MauE/DoxX family redox-associated membrane protein [Flavobacterium sp.]
MTNNTKNYIAWTLRVIIAFLFILSAVAKLSKGHLLDSPYFAISTFEVKQLYPMGFSEGFAPYFSRILIGIELALGFLILQNNFLKRFIIPVTTLMLLVFVGHLTYVTFLSGGNSGNCGCFGELLPMTPIQAIIKNIVAIGMLGWLFFLLPKKEYGGNFWVLTTVLFAAILGIFMLAPIQPPAVQLPDPAVETENVQETLATPESVVVDDTPAAVTPVKDTVKTAAAPKEQTEPAPHKSGYKSYFADIDKGKKLLCFLVPGCDHCRDAAKEITELRKKDKNFPPVRIIFMNEEIDLIPEFFKYAGAEYPYKIIDVIPFWNVLGSGKDTPGVKYMWNGNVYKYYWGITDNKFNPEEMVQLINKPFSELPKIK